VSLLNPTPGELADRATILALKITKGRQKGMDIGHFLEEESEVWSRLKSEGFAVVDYHFSSNRQMEEYKIWEGKSRDLITGLSITNSALWVMEDEVRKTPASDLAGLGKLCLSIAGANDKRSELIREINGHYFQDVKLEKLYEKKDRVFVSDIELGM
jgi:hypothetical protein